MILMPWLASFPPTPFMDSLGACYEAEVKRTLLADDMDGCLLLSMLALSPVLMRAPTAVQQWVSQLGEYDSAQAAHVPPEVLAQCRHDLLSTRPRLQQSCMAGPVMVGQAEGQVMAKCGRRSDGGPARACAGQPDGCTVVEHTYGDFQECPECCAAFHDAECMATHRYGAHARCTLLTLLAALPSGRPAFFCAPSTVEQLPHLMLLLQSSSNPHVALTADVASQVLAHCLEVPLTLCSAAAAFWVRSVAAAALNVCDDVTTSLAIHAADVFAKLSLNPAFVADRQLTACLVGLGLNQPRMRQAGREGALTGLLALARSSLLRSGAAPSGCSFLQAAAGAVSSEGWQALAQLPSGVSLLCAELLLLAADNAQHAAIVRHLIRPAVLDRLNSAMSGSCDTEMFIAAVCVAHILLTLNLGWGERSVLLPAAAGAAAHSGEAHRTVAGGASDSGTVTEAARRLMGTLCTVGNQAAEMVDWGHGHGAVALFQVVNGILNDAAVWDAVLLTEVASIPTHTWPVEGLVRTFAKDLSLLRRRIKRCRGGLCTVVPAPTAAFCESTPALAAEAQAAAVKAGLLVAVGNCDGQSSSQRRKAAKVARAAAAAATAGALAGRPAPVLDSSPDAPTTASSPARSTAVAPATAEHATQLPAAPSCPRQVPLLGTPAERLMSAQHPSTDAARPAPPAPLVSAAAPCTASSLLTIATLSPATPAPAAGASGSCSTASPGDLGLSVAPKPAGASALTEQPHPTIRAALASLPTLAPAASIPLDPVTPPSVSPSAPRCPLATSPAAAQALGPPAALAAERAAGVLVGQATRQAAGAAEGVAPSEDAELAGLLALLMAEAPPSGPRDSPDPVHPVPCSRRAHSPPGRTDIPPACRPDIPPAGAPSNAPPQALPVLSPAQPATSVAARPAAALEPPPDLCCPITMSLLVDPVVAADQCLYSRSAIEAWLTRSSISPMTGQPLASHHLVPCRPVYSMVRAWCEAHGVTPP